MKMNKNLKKALWISAIVLDVGITGFLFVVSIIMLVNTANIQTEADRQQLTGLIGFLANNPTVYLWAFVVPLFVILAANIIALVLYVRKTTKREPVKVNDLSEEQREALRQELLKDLSAPKEEPRPEEKTEDTPKE